MPRSTTLPWYLKNVLHECFISDEGKKNFGFIMPKSRSDLNKDKQSTSKVLRSHEVHGCDRFTCTPRKAVDKGQKQGSSVPGTQTTCGGS